MLLELANKFEERVKKNATCEKVGLIHQFHTDIKSRFKSHNVGMTCVNIMMSHTILQYSCTV